MVYVFFFLRADASKGLPDPPALLHRWLEGGAGVAGRLPQPLPGPHAVGDVRARERAAARRGGAQDSARQAAAGDGLAVLPASKGTLSEKLVFEAANLSIHTTAL